ncbi:MAG: hypothetical protein K2X66_10240, partial [Cyanobacteria bacterium]|nr:hypothetical protein [Cyanobacteriota bacterium]
TTQDKLRQLASGYFEHSPTSITSMMKDSIEHLSKPSQEKVYEAYENHIIQPFVNLFQKAFETHEISNPNARELAEMFVSLLDALVINYTVSEGRQFNFNLKANMLIQVLFEGIAFSLTQT